MLQTVRYTSFKNVLYLQLIYMIAELGSSTKLAVQDSPPEAWFKSYQFLKTPQHVNSRQGTKFMWHFVEDTFEARKAALSYRHMPLELTHLLLLMLYYYPPRQRFERFTLIFYNSIFPKDYSSFITMAQSTKAFYTSHTLVGCFEMD